MAKYKFFQYTEFNIVEIYSLIYIIVIRRSHEVLTAKYRKKIFLTATNIVQNILQQKITTFSPDFKSIHIRSKATKASDMLK